MQGYVFIHLTFLRADMYSRFLLPFLFSALGIAACAPAVAGESYALLSVGNAQLDGGTSNGVPVKLFVGAQPIPYVAFEMGYVNAGAHSFVADDITINSRTSGVGVAIRGIWPATDTLSVFGKAGNNMLLSSIEVPQWGVKDQTLLWSATLGVGFTYKFSNAIALRVEYEKITADLALTTAGLQFRF